MFGLAVLGGVDGQKASDGSREPQGGVIDLLPVGGAGIVSCTSSR